MEPIIQIRTLSEEVSALESKMNRAATSGEQGTVKVRLSGRGTVQVTIDNGDHGLGKAARKALASEVEQAVEQAIGKQRRRVAKETEELLASN